MTLQQRIGLMVWLGEYMKKNEAGWQNAQRLAASANPWFAPEFIQQASAAIAGNFLQRSQLEHWVKQYNVPDENKKPVTVGLVMAGNIPMVGFHDMLCIFITGNRQVIKLSSKDEILVKHLVEQLYGLDDEVRELISFADKIAGCEAYIATGSNNSGRYFDYYFGRYPNIIRRNRTSVAVLTGNETTEQLEGLADDIQSYFGLGCRNVTKLYVPEGYNFEPLLNVLKKYAHFSDYHKYRHNYDYQLALLMMGSKMYMTNGTVLFSENPHVFTAISHVHYEFYLDKEAILKELDNNADIQCIVGSGQTAFGQAQHPSLTDYADGADTMKFLTELSN